MERMVEYALSKNTSQIPKKAQTSLAEFYVVY